MIKIILSKQEANILFKILHAEGEIAKLSIDYAEFNQIDTDRLSPEERKDIEAKIEMCKKLILQLKSAKDISRAVMLLTKEQLDIIASGLSTLNKTLQRSETKNYPGIDREKVAVSRKKIEELYEEIGDERALISGKEEVKA